MVAKIGVIGTGWWATFNHIPTIQNSQDATITAICDLDSGRLAQVGEQFNIKNHYSDFNEMLTNENLDGVVVSTPHTQHTSPAISALNAGCHVLVEKPMATTASDGWQIAETAQKTGFQVLVPTGMNFTSFTEKAAQWIRDNKIGEIRHAICQMGSPLDDLFDGKPMLETTEHMFRPPASTWADPAKAGGYGWGQMSHSIAWLLYVTDLRFKNVICLDSKSSTGVDYYDAVAGTATNGATISLSGSSTVPKHKGMHMDIRIYGTEGMIVFDNERARLGLFRLDGNDDEIEISAQDAEYDGTLPVKVFAKLCAGQNVINASNGDCGAKVTEVLDAMYKSAKSKTLVSIGD